MKNYEDVMKELSGQVKTTAELIYMMVTGNSVRTFPAWLAEQTGGLIECIIDLYAGGKDWVLDAERETLDGLYHDFCKASHGMRALMHYHYLGSVYIGDEVGEVENLLDNGKVKLDDGEYTEMLDALDTAMENEREWFLCMLDQCAQTPYVQSLRHVFKMWSTDYYRKAKAWMRDVELDKMSLETQGLVYAWEMFNKAMGDHRYETFMANWHDYWKDGVKQPLLKGKMR